jgi:hypothetical protein
MIRCPTFAQEAIIATRRYFKDVLAAAYFRLASGKCLGPALSSACAL